MTRTMMRTWTWTWAALVLALLGCGRDGAARQDRPGAACAPAACEQRCAAHDAAACARLAELYFDGKNGHPLDMARSYRYATTACAGGDSYGCMFVGRHHQDGLGADFDPARAVATYESACAAGVGVACYNLASMYMGGHGVVPDFARGRDYQRRAAAAWQAACKGGDVRWCTNAAFALAEDSDGEPSMAVQQAQLALDERACAAEVLVGCTERARLQHRLGTLAATAYLAELERLCGAGEPSACTLAGLSLVNGKDAPADPARGLALVTRGCDAGDADGCLSLGMELGAGERVARDVAAADRYLRTACDRASGLACLTLAEVLRDRADHVTAVGFGRRACHMGQAEGCFLVAVAYHQGLGVAASEPDADRWSEEGCRGGLAVACAPLVARGVALPLPADLAARIRTRLCADGMAAACPPR